MNRRTFLGTLAGLSTVVSQSPYPGLRADITTNVSLPEIKRRALEDFFVNVFANAPRPSHFYNGTFWVKWDGEKYVEYDPNDEFLNGTGDRDIEPAGLLNS